MTRQRSARARLTDRPVPGDRLLDRRARDEGAAAEIVLGLFVAGNIGSQEPVKLARVAEAEGAPVPSAV